MAPDVKKILRSASALDSITHVVIVFSLICRLLLIVLLGYAALYKYDVLLSTSYLEFYGAWLLPLTHV